MLRNKNNKSPFFLIQILCLPWFRLQTLTSHPIQSGLLRCSWGIQTCAYSTSSNQPCLRPVLFFRNDQSNRVGKVGGQHPGICSHTACFILLPLLSRVGGPIVVSVVVSGWAILGQFEICDHLWSGFRGGDPLPNLISLVSFCLWRLRKGVAWPFCRQLRFRPKSVIWLPSRLRARFSTAGPKAWQKAGNEFVTRSSLDWSLSFPIFPLSFPSFFAMHGPTYYKAIIA